MFHRLHGLIPLMARMMFAGDTSCKVSGDVFTSQYYNLSVRESRAHVLCSSPIRRRCSAIRRSSQQVYAAARLLNSSVARLTRVFSRWYPMDGSSAAPRIHTKLDPGLITCLLLYVSACDSVVVMVVRRLGMATTPATWSHADTPPTG